MESKHHCCDCSSDETCGSVSCGGRSYFITRWIFGFIAIMLAFCLGLQIGQLQTLAGVSPFGSYGHMSGFRGGMMDANYVFTTAVPAGQSTGIKVK